MNSITNEPFDPNQPLYCSYSKINGKPQRLILTPEQLLNSNDSSFVMNPFIFYRLKETKSLDLTKLPLINLSKFYCKSGSEEEYIKFTVKKINMITSSKKDFAAAISDQDLKDCFANLRTFSKDADRQLLKQIDKYIATELKDKAIDSLSMDDFDMKKFDLKNERLKDLSKDLISMRTDLFLRYTKQFIAASEKIDYQGKVKQGSLSYYFLKNKSLALNSVKDKLLEQQIFEMLFER